MHSEVSMASFTVTLIWPNSVTHKAQYNGKLEMHKMNCTQVVASVLAGSAIDDEGYCMLGEVRS